MKKINKYIFILISILAMSSCYRTEGNWFYHPIDMEGETTKPELVVNGTLAAGEPACIYVNSTRNLQDKSNWDTLYLPDPRDTTRIYSLPIYKRQYIADAIVEMSVDGGDWQALHAEYFEQNYKWSFDITYSIANYRYISDAVLLPGQEVSLRVSHKDFEQMATVTQTIPHFPEASVANVDTIRENKMVKYDIQMAAYPKSDDYLLKITSTMYGHQYQHYYDNDAEYTYPQYYSYLYSQDARFAKYDALLRRISLGYFSADKMGLYAPLENEATTYAMASYFMPTYVSTEYGSYQSSRTDSVVVNISAVSPDEYTNAVSLASAGIIKQDLIDPFMIDNPAESVSQDINNMLNTLGNLEGSQVFDNIDGGVGHVTAVANQHLVIRF